MTERKLELKVGDRVVLTGESWTDYGAEYAPGTVVTVDTVGLDGTAYNNKVGSLTAYGGVPYTINYTIEKCDDPTKSTNSGAVLQSGGSGIRIENGIGRALTVDYIKGAWFLLLINEHTGQKTRMRIEQNAIDDLRAFLEYWSNHGKA